MSDVVAEKIVVPRFATESEEADWWFEHREEHGRIMAKAMDEGRTMTMKQLLESRGIRASQVTDELLGHGLTLRGLREVAVPIKEEDAALARRQADEAGMNYHDYMGKLLHEALEKHDAA